MEKALLFFLIIIIIKVFLVLTFLFAFVIKHLSVFFKDVNCFCILQHSQKKLLNFV